MTADLDFTAHSLSKRRYSSYSEADFEVFRPAGATRCSDGGAIWHWHGGGAFGPLLRAKFHPYRCKFRWICSRGYGVMGG